MTLILGIETSCDETSASIVKDGIEILSNVVKTQAIHQSFGGVVPDLSSREHVKFIYDIINESLKTAGIYLKEIDAVSSVNGPGLVGSLMIGLMTAKGISIRYKKPLITTNHVIGHIYGNLLTHKKLEFPMLSLVVSGGHTSLYIVDKEFNVKQIGQTRDDAAGEAFDKCAKMLSLPYPGGPSLEKAALGGNPKFHIFPRAHMPGFDFSFSGLKTSVLYYLREKSDDFKKNNIADISASIQSAIVRQLIAVTKRAFDEHEVKSVSIAGGVSANKQLRSEFEKTFTGKNAKVYVPEFILCTDNAALSAGYSYMKYMNNDFSDLSVNVYSRT